MCSKGTGMLLTSLKINNQNLYDKHASCFGTFNPFWVSFIHCFLFTLVVLKVKIVLLFQFHKRGSINKKKVFPPLPREKFSLGLGT